MSITLILTPFCRNLAPDVRITRHVRGKRSQGPHGVFAYLFARSCLPA